jgi:hypothetical protein
MEDEIVAVHLCNMAFSWDSVVSCKWQCIGANSLGQVWASAKVTQHMVDGFWIVVTFFSESRPARVGSQRRQGWTKFTLFQHWVTWIEEDESLETWECTIKAPAIKMRINPIPGVVMLKHLPDEWNGSSGVLLWLKYHVLCGLSTCRALQRETLYTDNFLY